MNRSRKNLPTLRIVLAAAALQVSVAAVAQSNAVRSQVVPTSGFNAADLTSSYQTVVQRRNLTAKVAAMAKTFPSTPAGNALAMVAVLTPSGFRPYNTAEVGIVAVQLNYLNQHPADALAAIQQGFAQLPAPYFAEPAAPWRCPGFSRLTPSPIRHRRPHSPSASAWFSWGAASMRITGAPKARAPP